MQDYRHAIDVAFWIGLFFKNHGVSSVHPKLPAMIPPSTK